MKEDMEKRPSPPVRGFGHLEGVSSEKIVETLRQCAGVVSAAAQILQVPRRTLHRRIHTDPDLVNALEDIREETLDLAEGQFFKLIANGDREAIRFYLRCFGKRRGWIESVRIEGANGGPVQHLVADASSAFDRKLAGAIALASQGAIVIEHEPGGEGV